MQREANFASHARSSDHAESGKRRPVAASRAASVVNAPAFAPRRNADFRWDDFDPDLYVKHNYLELRDDDLRILQVMRDEFAKVLDPDRPVPAAIDVGAGPNLYPALSMLPFCHHLTLWERSLANVHWLQREIPSYSPMWEDYWHVLRTREPYERVPDPRAALRQKATVRRGDLFRLPQRKWNLGTMFFVAESISPQEREFRLAVEKFINALTPGAPFAIAFMEDSAGYNVGPLRFPAVAVTEADVDDCLRLLSDDFHTRPIRSTKPLRDGYHGMILAIGKAGRAKG